MSLAAGLAPAVLTIPGLLVLVVLHLTAGRQAMVEALAQVAANSVVMENYQTKSPHQRISP
jgi:hypothetical protein